MPFTSGRNQRLVSWIIFQLIFEPAFECFFFLFNSCDSIPGNINQANTHGTHFACLRVSTKKTKELNLVCLIRRSSKSVLLVWLQEQGWKILGYYLWPDRPRTCANQLFGELQHLLSTIVLGKRSENFWFWCQTSDLWPVTWPVNAEDFIVEFVQV